MAELWRWMEKIIINQLVYAAR